MLGKHVAGATAFLSNFVYWGRKRLLRRGCQDQGPAAPVEPRHRGTVPRRLACASHPRLALSARRLRRHRRDDRGFVRRQPLPDGPGAGGGLLFAGVTGLELMVGGALPGWPRAAGNGRRRRHRSLPGQVSRSSSPASCCSARRALFPAGGRCCPRSAPSSSSLPGRRRCSIAWSRPIVRWSRWGLISYPLYLWHWPLLAFARIFGRAADGRAGNWRPSASRSSRQRSYILVERADPTGRGGRDQGGLRAPRAAPRWSASSVFSAIRPTAFPACASWIRSRTFVRHFDNSGPVGIFSGRQAARSIEATAISTTCSLLRRPPRRGLRGRRSAEVHPNAIPPSATR